MTPTERYISDIAFAEQGKITHEADSYSFLPDALAPGVSLELIADGDTTVWLNGITSTRPGEGHTRGVLDLLTGVADDRGITLRGNALPYGEKPGLTRDELLRWYERHDFSLKQSADEERGIADIICRKPKIMRASV